jgi:chemotaxis-related protein WspB
MLLLCLQAGPNRYAIVAKRVIELVPSVPLRPLPHAPSFLSGLLGYRGHVVPVIDLGSLFCGVPCRNCLSTRIILVNDAPNDHNQEHAILSAASEKQFQKPSDLTPGMNILGLIGEQVSDLTDVEPERFMATPVQLPQLPFLDAIVQTDDGILQLIAVERIREAALSGHLLNQGSVWEQSPMKVETQNTRD